MFRRYSDAIAALTLAVSLISAAGCDTVSSTNPELAGQDVRLTIFHSSDIHSRLLPYDMVLNTTDTDLGMAPEGFPYGGAARLRALYLREKATASRSILLDSGDVFEGSPLFNVSDGEVEFRFMSLLHPDASVVGNHEFDKGAENFAIQAKKWIDYPLLVANYQWGDPSDPTQTQLGEMTRPFTILNAEGLRIGVIGLGNLSSLSNLTQGGNTLGAIALETNEVTRQYVGLLSPLVDLIVIVSHLGLDADQALIQGYDDYYPYSAVQTFLNRSENPWMIVDIVPPQDASEEDDATSSDGTVNLGKLNPNRIVHVFIPPVQNIDVIMGGHLHIVLQPANALDESVVQRLYQDGGVATDPSAYQRNSDGSDVFQIVSNTDTYNGQPRQPVIVDSGAFAKYLGRFDAVVSMPPAQKPAGLTDAQWALRQAVGGEVSAQTFHQIAIDSLWCLSPRPVRDTSSPTFAQFEATAEASRQLCAQQEDPETLNLLAPYILEENSVLELPRVFAYTANQINRVAVAGASASQDAELGAGGDSQLGNLVAESMREEEAVSAEFALTNSLGIRDNIYAGPINLEQMFNVFPFENTLTIQYLSGDEIQRLLDFITDDSASRGCAAQAQVAGLSFVQDCGRSIHNTAPSCDNRLSGGIVPDPCAPVCQVDSDCLAPALTQRYGSPLPDGPGYFANICPGQATTDSPPNTACYCNRGLCYAHSSHDIQVNGTDLSINGSYKGVVNNYIAAGGSGFKVLQINTSKVQTGISMRDALISYMINNYCACSDILAGNPACARLPDQNGSLIIDPSAVTYCQHAKLYQSYLTSLTSQYGTSVDDVIASHPERLLDAPTGVSEGACECGRALAAQLDPDPICGHVTQEIKEFCKAPMDIPMVTAYEDSRIVIQTQ